MVRGGYKNEAGEVEIMRWAIGDGMLGCSEESVDFLNGFFGRRFLKKEGQLVTDAWCASKDLQM